LDAGPDASIPVFLVTQGFATDTRENGEKPNESGREVLEIGRKARSFETLQQLENAHSGHLKADFLKFGTFRVVQQFESVGLALTHIFAPFLLREPVLVTAELPAGEILLGNTKVHGFGRGLQFLKDVVVGAAIADHLIDLIAEQFGKPSDFAAAVGTCQRERDLTGSRAVLAEC